MSYPDASAGGSFWSVFHRSRIPITVLDRDRRYVALNDAAVELYQRPREELIGQRATSGRPDEDPAIEDASWEQLVRDGELYGDEVVHFKGGPMRVSYAAHTTTRRGQWLAVFVILSARRRPGGEELVAPVAVADLPDDTGGGGSTPFGKELTPREREIVHRVALGRNTPQIATDLGLSPATVRSHVRSAMVKAGVHTRAHLVARMLGEGLAQE
jgi:DNA-binding CsgD family transcriptional regulator